MVEVQAFLLTSAEGQLVSEAEIESLESSEEEIDTRIVIYLFHAKQQGYKYNVANSFHSEVFSILFYYPHNWNPHF